jgi:hypothetical protein
MVKWCCYKCLSTAPEERIPSARSSISLTMSFAVEPGEFIHRFYILVMVTGSLFQQSAQLIQLCLSTTDSTLQLVHCMLTVQKAVGNSFEIHGCTNTVWDIRTWALRNSLCHLGSSQSAMFLINRRSEHTLGIALQRRMAMFPFKKMRRSNIRSTQPFPVFCSCQMPELPGDNINVQNGIMLILVFRYLEMH